MPMCERTVVLARQWYEPSKYDLAVIGSDRIHLTRANLSA